MERLAACVLTGARSGSLTVDINSLAYPPDHAERMRVRRVRDEVSSQVLARRQCRLVKRVVSGAET
ncbi:hypothetical protein [Kibdelosporangium philippinense]|uniref:hypothetical protein n=1 Tax=Kibdelosporangium philippinense TaxID=211113 RepID=UPI00360801E2